MEVLSVKWLVDDETGILISKKGLVSGIRFLDDTCYHGNFSETEMKEYLDKCMLPELTQSITPICIQNMALEKMTRFEDEKLEDEKIKKPYVLKLGPVKIKKK